MFKRTLMAGALALALQPTGASAQTWTDTGGTVLNGVNDRSNATRAPGYCQITVTAAATTVAALLASGVGGSCAVPSWSTWAYFRPSTAGTAVVRCVADSTALTAGLGFPLDGLADFPMAGGVQGGGPFSTIKCISTGASSVTVDIWWMG